MEFDPRKQKCEHVEVEKSVKTRAEKVQVYASKLAKLAADDKFKDIHSFIPLNMKWANSPPTGASVVIDGISPKMGAFATLFLSAFAQPFPTPVLFPLFTAYSPTTKTTVTALTSDFRPSTVQQFSLNLQAELVRDWLFEAGYICNVCARLTRHCLHHQTTRSEE
jgi:hypothetical protein